MSKILDLAARRNAALAGQCPDCGQPLTRVPARMLPPYRHTGPGTYEAQSIYADHADSFDAFACLACPFHYAISRLDLDKLPPPQATPTLPTDT